MRIAFLCKRRYMNKDVVLDRYARLYEIPRQLALLGHDVLGLCLSYYPAEGIDVVDTHSDGRLRWVAPETGKLRLPDIIAYPHRTLALLQDFKPDIVIGASDAPHTALARWLARKLDVPYAIDLYDNFESFSLSRIPGLIPAMRRAVRDAAWVTTTSKLLRDYVVSDYHARGDVLPMPSTIDKTIFYPRDRKTSRAALGLPFDARLIGTAGGLYRDKGIATLYNAWDALRDRYPNLHLVLAGPYEPALPPPKGPRVHYLGAIPHTRVAELFCALDVGVICIEDTPFGRYCFPQKAYEMLACGLPVVAADVGAMRDLFADTTQTLFAAGDVAGLVDQLQKQLTSPELHNMAIEDWPALIAKLNAYLQKTSS